MPTSTIFSFEQALVANLKARAGLNGVQVVDGPPTGGQSITGTWIMVGNVRSTQTWKNFARGAYPKQEDYYVDVVIVVTMASHDAQTMVTKQAFALLAEIENELREADGSYQQGVANIMWGQVNAVDVKKGLSPDGAYRTTALECKLLVHARI